MVLEEDVQGADKLFQKVLQKLDAFGFALLKRHRLQLYMRIRFKICLKFILIINHN